MLKWSKDGDNVLLRANGWGVVLTKTDIENGLKVLAEKPVFFARNPYMSYDLYFQKQSNGKIKFRIDYNSVWCDITTNWFGFGEECHYPEVFEAYAKALRS